MNIFSATHNLRHRVSVLETGGTYTRRVAVSGDGASNMSRIEAAMREVKPHGGVVELDGGDYALTTVQGTTPGASAGAYCLRIPSNVRLKGQGKSETNLLFTAGGAFGTGACITPEGMDTATADYGAASNWALSDMTISATDQAASSGNLISLYHASDFLLENLDLGACYYHCLEVGTSRRGIIRKVQFSGDHQGGSGNYIQFDNGDGGHRSTVPTTNVIDDITFEDIVMLQRPNTGAVRDIEGFHATNQTLQNIRFRRLKATGQARASSFIFDFNTAPTSGGARGVYFDDCEFVTGHYDNMAIRIAPPGAGGYHEGVFIRDCVFRGPSCRSLWAYGNTTATVNITNNDRRDYHILRNRFYFDATQMPASAYDYFPLVVNQITGAVVQGNRFEKTGDFPVGWSHVNGCSVIRIGNCRDASVLYNDISWLGNNATTSRTALYWSNEASDLTGMTRRSICRGNTLYSENKNWSYGILMQTRLASSPQCVHAFTDNTSTGATSGANDAIETTA